MKTPPIYSSLVSCLYDEPDPVGNIGRGTHYSVFRSVEWLDVVRAPLSVPQVHDFAVIWDEDHDVRVMEAVESIYMAGLLSPVQFIGERKGMLTVIVAAKFYWNGVESDLNTYVRRLGEIAARLPSGDAWSTQVGMFDRQPGSPHQTELHGLIATDEHRAVTYVRNIDSLWSLGTKTWTARATPAELTPG